MTKNGRPAAVLMSAEEYESWKETRTIQKNPALMEDIRRGLHQLKKGQRFSFEEVFGEPLKNSSGKNDPLSPGNVPGLFRDLLGSGVSASPTPSLQRRGILSQVLVDRTTLRDFLKNPKI